MMKINYGKFEKIIFILLAMLCVLSGCEKKSISAEKDNEYSWTSDDGVVAVLFGLGYNEQPFMDETVNLLQQKFGLEKDGGIIWPLYFPEDFKIDGITRVSLLPEVLKKKKLCGLIILGMPEKMYSSLCGLKDSMQKNDFKNGKPYPVFSLFSQDNVLGTEAGSDLVFDFKSSHTAIVDILEEIESMENSSQEESDILYLTKVPELLLDSVLGILNYNQEVSEGKKISDIAQSIFSDKWIVEPYFDGVTGLRSFNHFVLEEIPEQSKSAK